MFERIETIVDQVNWDNSRLIPAVVQCANSGVVLMVGFVNQEALKFTLRTGFMHYFSRSKGRIWRKGEVSGHFQKVIEAFLDCDNDTLLFKVDQEGVACHTGRQSCFYHQINLTKGEVENIGQIIDMSEKYSVLDRLYHTLQEKKNVSPSQSYTASLYAKGSNEIYKKIIEEASEFILALKDNDKTQIIYECADLVYHMLVGLSDKNVNLDLVKCEIKRRFGMSGLDEKNSREK